MEVVEVEVVQDNERASSMGRQSLLEESCYC